MPAVEPPFLLPCRAAEALGIGQLSEEELFSVYVEFMLLCHVDPGYKASVEASAKHSAYYARAGEHAATYSNLQQHAAMHRC